MFLPDSYNYRKILSTIMNLVTFQYVKIFLMRQVVKLINVIQFFDVVDKMYQYLEDLYN